MCSRVGGLERESGREGEDERMGAVQPANRGALCILLDILAARPTWLVVIEA